MGDSVAVGPLMPELWLLSPNDHGSLFGAFQTAEIQGALRRASGGAEVLLGPGTLHALLILPTLSVFEPTRTDAILNRAVRPFLKSVSRAGTLAHYFGRDWFSVRHRPVAAIGFAHSAGTQRTMVEVSVGVTRSVFPRERPSHRGRTPSFLAELASNELTVEGIADRIESGVAVAHQLTSHHEPLPRASSASRGDAFLMTARPSELSISRQEPIGPIGIGRDGEGTPRIAGEFMASVDALLAFEAQVFAADFGRNRARVRERVAAAFSQRFPAQSSALFGVQPDALIELVAAWHAAP